MAEAFIIATIVWFVVASVGTAYLYRAWNRMVDKATRPQTPPGSPSSTLTLRQPIGDARRIA